MKASATAVAPPPTILAIPNPAQTSFKLSWPSELPIVERREEIRDAIAAHQVVVVCGETGSGKSTQLPKICLDAGRGSAGRIGHTQPRRIAARSIAARVAQELQTELGKVVGYKIRFNDRTSPEAVIKVMTDGILLAETQGDRRLGQYDTIIIDEAHERSLNIDFLLGYLKRLLPQRPDLHLIITSATIDPRRFSEHFGDAPILEVSGRTYPVEVLYRPLTVDEGGVCDLTLTQGILRAVDELAKVGEGDILIFLPGERDIRETAEALRKHHPPQTEILPLYARLSAEEQNRIFEPHRHRRIVLATNVAETSLTVPGIRYVVDSGLARISRYSSRSRVQRLPIESVSQASARQRAGRCGRLGPGVCVRLYGEAGFEKREPFTPPEIQRTNLAGVILQMSALRLGNPARFPFLDPPTRRMIRDGYDTLHELGAIDDRHRLTMLGKKLARLPVDPRIGRMILAAEEENCLREVLVIASALSIQDPRERPMDRPDAADAAHDLFRDEESDFLTLLKVWTGFHEQKKHLSWNKLRKWSVENFLNFLRMREWQDIHGQLKMLAGQQGMKLNEETAGYDAVHRAVLTGLLSQIATRGDQHEYRGAYGSTCWIHPGSALFGRGPRWLVAAEMVETTRRYARTAARIQVKWIEQVGSHLLKRHYADAQWDRRSGQAFTFETVSIFGLDIVTRRRVPLGRIDQATARELFILHALVEGESDINAPFFRHNRNLVSEVQKLEDKHRRRDILVDPRRHFDFYDRRMPHNIYSTGGFHRWRRSAERDDPRLLFMQQNDLMKTGTDLADSQLFPDALEIPGGRLPLIYRFEPGETDDGVTLRVPVEVLNQIPAQRLEWLVPGLLREKVIALMRSLPKHLRRSFVPIPDVADSILTFLEFGRGRLREATGNALKRATGVEVPPDAWGLAPMPDHLRMNLRVVDAEGRVIAEARDLEDLRIRCGNVAETSLAGLAPEQFQRDRVTTWDFGDLPLRVTMRRAGVEFQASPAVVDAGDSVSLRLVDSQLAAERLSRRGLARLFLLQVQDELPAQLDHLAGIHEVRLHAASLPRAISREAVRTRTVDEHIAMLISDRAFLARRPLPRSEPEFQRRLDEGWRSLWQAGLEVIALAGDTLRMRHELELELESFDKPVWREAVADVRRQLETLMPADFLEATPWERLEQFPRYLRGVSRRLERLRSGGLERDRRAEAEMRDLWRQYQERRAEHAAGGLDDPALEEYRWLLEEYRISLFAQDVGTSVPVSGKRLRQAWEDVRN